MKLNLILFSLLIIFALVKINAHHLYRVNYHSLEIEKRKTIELKDEQNQLLIQESSKSGNGRISEYAKSKLDGELSIQKNFPLATILRPSVVYSVDDNFTTSFMTLLSRLPFFPLYYNGSTKFAPIHCSDLTDTIYHVVSKNIYSKIVECIGPDVLSLKEILKKLLYLIGKKRLLVPLPLFAATMSAKVFQLFPKPLLTIDQLTLLKYDNVPSGKYQTNADIGVPSTRVFDSEVEKYSYMWREGGQFSTKKYNPANS